MSRLNPPPPPTILWLLLAPCRLLVRPHTASLQEPGTFLLTSAPVHLAVSISPSGLLCRRQVLVSSRATPRTPASLGPTALPSGATWALHSEMGRDTVLLELPPSGLSCLDLQKPHVRPLARPFCPEQGPLTAPHPPFLTSVFLLPMEIYPSRVPSLIPYSAGAGAGLSNELWPPAHQSGALTL